MVLIMKKVICFQLALAFFIIPIVSQAGINDTYDFSWLDPDKEVYVLQNRKFRKVNRAYMYIGGGKTTSGAFVDSNPIQLRGGFFLKEDLGFEVIYSKNLTGEESDAAKAVRNIGGGAGSRPFRRIVDNYYGGYLMWSPFYAKINTFNKILYFDWLLGVGAGKLVENNNKEEVAQKNNPQIQTVDHTAIMWETGFKLYITKMFDIRTDVTALHYKAEMVSGTETWYSNYDLTVSLGINF